MPSTDQQESPTLVVRLLDMENMGERSRIADPIHRARVLRIVQEAYRLADVDPATLGWYPRGTMVLAGSFADSRRGGDSPFVGTSALKTAASVEALDSTLEVDPTKLAIMPAYPVAVAARAAAAKGVRGVYRAMRPGVVRISQAFGFEAQGGLNAEANKIAAWLQTLGYDIHEVGEDNLDRVIFAGKQVVNWLPRDRFELALMRLSEMRDRGEILDSVWHQETIEKYPSLGATPFS